MLEDERSSRQAFAKHLSLPVALVYTLNAGELHVWCQLQHLYDTVKKDEKWT